MVLLVACGQRKDPPPNALSEAAPPPSRRADSSPPSIPAETTQLLTATTADWDATTAELRLWTRDGAHGRWQPDGPAWQSTIGRSGLGWGRGIHGDGIPDGRTGPLKQEGDGRSPAGLFAVGRAFGYAPAPPAGTRLSYTAVDSSWRCVDDPASTHYTQILDERTVTLDWSSAEQMRRDDPLYTWVLEVRHNPAATPGGGSCIFLHVWGGPDDTTVGCTAMPEPTLASLLTRLDPARRPLVALLPRPEYDALATAWSLPR